MNVNELIASLQIEVEAGHGEKTALTLTEDGYLYNIEEAEFDSDEDAVVLQLVEDEEEEEEEEEEDDDLELSDEEVAADAALDLPIVEATGI